MERGRARAVRGNARGAGRRHPRLGARSRRAARDRKSTRPELQSPCNLVCRLLLEKKKTREAETVRRDLVAVLDVFGSMSGHKLDQAKAALVKLIGTVRSGYLLHVITFLIGVYV